MQEQREGASVVAVFNSTPDALLMLRMALEHAGFSVVTALIRELRDELALDALVRQHQPQVIVYDVAPPYDAEWQMLRRSKARHALARCTFILTSTNKPIVERLSAADPQIFTVIGTPYELQDVVRAVSDAVKARHSG